MSGVPLLQPGNAPRVCGASSVLPVSRRAPQEIRRHHESSDSAICRSCSIWTVTIPSGCMRYRWARCLLPARSSPSCANGTRDCVSSCPRRQEPDRSSRAGMLGEVDGVFYFPFDWAFSTRRVLDVIRPRLFVMIETEIWPNLLRECRRRGISTVLVNGRISYQLLSAVPAGPSVLPAGARRHRSFLRTGRRVGAPAGRAWC